MNFDKFDRDQYERRCSIIQKLIHGEYANEHFDFVINQDTLYVEVYINTDPSEEKSHITLLPDITWKDVTRYIDKTLDVQRRGISEDCSVCCETIQKM